MSPRRAPIAAVSLLLGVLPAQAASINTAESGGAYHAGFCPRLESELKQARFSYSCATSEGTVENLARVREDPRQIGFGQLDILALEGALGAPDITILRHDDVRECLFAVTRNKDAQTYGDLAAGAAKLRFILPPERSGSAATFRFLARIDEPGVGRARQITHAESTDAAIRQALSADDTVTLFVQFPDPDSDRFRLVNELGGHFVPLVDRAILRPQVDGRKIYFAQETQVADASWSRAGQKVVTVCTPLVVFTGPAERLGGDRARQDHRDLIATVRALRSEALLPAESTFTGFMRRTRELSAVTVERFTKLSEEAREQAKPYLERAKEASEKAIEAAKPTLERARKLGKEILEKAQEQAKELVDPPKPEPPKQP